MKNPAIVWCVVLVFVLALLAASAGFFWQIPGEPFEFLTLRGEKVTIFGSGLYRYDSISMVAQAQANDLVTLALGLPLLLVSSWLSWRGSLRGRLLLAGTMAYFLYTYMAYAFLAAYNPFFLVYVALFTLSLFGFILVMMSFDLNSLKEHFSERLPRRYISGLMFFAGAFLLLAWLGRIVPALLQGVPPYGLESYTTLVIQVMDLGLIVPLTILSGILLLQRRPWGYLLSSVAVMKFLSMGIAVSAMAVNETLSGVDISLVELMVFPAISLLNIIAAVLLLKNVNENKPAPSSV